jgi:peptide/nickel transport system permease protein
MIQKGELPVEPAEAALEIAVGRPLTSGDLVAGSGATRTLRAMMREARRRRTSMLGLVLSAVFVFTGIFAPVLAPESPTSQDLLHTLAHPFVHMSYLLGTDDLGRDMLSRVIFGAQNALLVSTLTVAIAASIGTVLGLIAGFWGGAVDALIMRLVDAQLAFPYILLAILVGAALGPSLLHLVMVLVIASWAIYARVVRGSVLEIRHREFITAARALGATKARTVVRHVFPNVLTPLIVVASLEVGNVIIAAAALSFLGVGSDPRASAWGSMLALGRDYMQTAWWLPVFPGIAISLTVLGTNLVGNLLRDALDPRSAQ